MDKKLYRLISKARESCAGSSVKDIQEVIELNKAALQYAVFIGADRSIQDSLSRVDGLLREAKDYGDRLEPDNILCSVLNQMLKE